MSSLKACYCNLLAQIKECRNPQMKLLCGLWLSQLYSIVDTRIVNFDISGRKWNSLIFYLA